MTRLFLLLTLVVLLFAACEKNGSADAAAAIADASSTGVGGSLAKFTIVGNYVYAVSSHYLYTVDISDPAAPKRVSQSPLNFDMETIYPYKNRLFIGSRTGLYIYSIDTGSVPRLIGEAKHG